MFKISFIQFGSFQVEGFNTPEERSARHAELCMNNRCCERDEKALQITFFEDGMVESGSMFNETVSGRASR